jgi:hypothetical protein
MLCQCGSVDCLCQHSLLGCCLHALFTTPPKQAMHCAAASTCFTFADTLYSLHNIISRCALPRCWPWLCWLLRAGGFIQGSPVLSWVGNNTAKLQLQHGPAFPHMQCWTLISTNSYGQVGRTSQSVLLHDIVYDALPLAMTRAAQTSVLISLVLLPGPAHAPSVQNMCR